MNTTPNHGNYDKMCCGRERASAAEQQQLCIFSKQRWFKQHSTNEHKQQLTALLNTNTTYGNEGEQHMFQASNAAERGSAAE